MELTLLIDPALRAARLREVASLAAGDSYSLVLDGIPGADPGTLSVALYRDASMADLVAAASPEDGAPAFSRVPGHARRFASAEPWRLDSLEMASWFVFEADRLEESSDGGGSAVPRGWTGDDRRTSAERAMRADGWLVVADASRVWVACRVPVVLRDIVGRGHLSGDSISSIVQGAVASALDGKIDKVPGMSLSSNDFTDALKARLEGIEAGAERNVQADWDESDPTADAFVRNRPGLATESEDGLMPAADRAKVAGLDAALAAKADLVDGKVPASQLPSYVDDVLEFASSALFPDEGEAGKIYVATGTGLAYRWSGSAYVAVAAPTEVGSDDGQAFPGPRGALLERTAAAHGATLAELEAAVSALASAERNVQADWEESDAENDAYIRRKPTLAAVATSGQYSDLEGRPTLAAVATSGQYSDLDGAPTLSRVAATGLYSDLSGAPALAAVATSGRYSDLEGRPSAGGLAVRIASVTGRVARLVDSAVSTVASSAASSSWTAWEWSSPSWSSGTDGLSQPVRDGDVWKASDPVRGVSLSAEADSESSDDMTADGGPSVLAMSGTRELRLVVTALPRADLPAGSYTREEILASATTPATVGCVTSGGDVLWSVEVPVADLLVERASSAITGEFDVASGGFVYGAVAGLRHDGSDFTVDLDDARNSQAFTGQTVVTDQPFAAVASVSAVATRRWARAVDAVRLPEPRGDRLSRVAVVDLVSDGTPVRLIDESSDSVDMPAPSEGATLYQILDTARGPSVVRLTPDRTLSVDGAPADAKAVRAALAGLESDDVALGARIGMAEQEIGGKLWYPAAFRMWDDPYWQGSWPAGAVVSWDGWLYRTAAGTTDGTAEPGSGTAAAQQAWTQVTIDDLLKATGDALAQKRGLGDLAVYEQTSTWTFTPLVDGAYLDAGPDWIATEEDFNESVYSSAGLWDGAGWYVIFGIEGEGKGSFHPSGGEDATELLVSSDGRLTRTVTGWTPVSPADTLAKTSQLPTVPSAYTSTPAMDGTGSAGNSTAWARGDHVHPSDTSKVSANSSITGATKCKVTYDSKGLVTAGSDLEAADIPSLPASKIGSGTLDAARLPVATGNSAGAVILDRTLSVQDRAADAKATGDAIVLSPVYTQTATFTEWTAPEGFAFTGIDETNPPMVSFTYGGEDYYGYISDMPTDSTLSITLMEEDIRIVFSDYDGGDVTFTRERTDVAGYTLGSQTTKPLQPQGDYLTAAALPYPFVSATPSGGTLTITPRTVATYTAGTTAAAFTVAVGTGVAGAARDCVLVVDCFTNTGAVAPTVTWPNNFHPRGDAEEIAPVAGVRNVFYISEYAAGEFVVGGWHEEVA